MDTTERTELGLTPSDRSVVLVGFPIAGAVLAVVLPFLWRLVDDVNWLPFRGPLEALMSLDHGWQSVLRVVVLAAAGLAFGVYVVLQDTRVRVGPDDILVIASGATRVIQRDRVAGVHHNGKHLVIETETGRKLLDAPVENAKKQGGAIFTRYGYPWENAV